MWNVNLLTKTCYKGCATTYNNHNNIIIMTTLARLILTKHQIATALSNFGSFSFRLPSAIIKLSKTESKTQDNKRLLNFKSDHFPFSSDSDPDSIINFFVRDSRKRLKRINILSNQNTFKPKSSISLTTSISPSPISLTTFISSLSDQRIFKPRSFTPFISINIIQKQIKTAFFKIRLGKRIFERDFSRYNKALNKVFR